MRYGQLRASALASVMVLLFGAVVFAQQPPTARSSGSLTAEQIVELATEVYARCDSYRDSGVAGTTYLSDDREWTAEKPFTTIFVRPDRIRFEFKDMSAGDPPPTYIIWAEGDDVRTWSDSEPGINRQGSLGEAIADAAGVSQGASHRIPSMLLPDASAPKSALELSYARRIDNAEVDGFECFRIRGQSIRTPRTLGSGENTVVLSENSSTIWIDKQSYLVRRVDESNVYDSFSTDTVTTYNPEINVEIPSELLAFAAPDIPGS
jgi:outer membrane lipoprotein-sorting protein